MTIKAEKVWFPYSGASSVPCAMDFSSVLIASLEMVRGPCPLCLYLHGHPGLCPSASDRRNCSLVAELELLFY